MVDPKIIQTVKHCLETSFRDVHHLHQRFLFHDGTQSSELVFNREFLENISEPSLFSHLVKDIIPTLKANPGKRISVNSNGIGIGPRETN